MANFISRFTKRDDLEGLFHGEVFLIGILYPLARKETLTWPALFAFADDLHEDMEEYKEEWIEFLEACPPSEKESYWHLFVYHRFHNPQDRDKYRRPPAAPYKTWPRLTVDLPTKILVWWKKPACYFWKDDDTDDTDVDGDDKGSFRESDDSSPGDHTSVDGDDNGSLHDSDDSKAEDKDGSNEMDESNDSDEKEDDNDETNNNADSRDHQSRSSNDSDDTKRSRRSSNDCINDQKEESEEGAPNRDENDGNNSTITSVAKRRRTVESSLEVIDQSDDFGQYMTEDEDEGMKEDEDEDQGNMRCFPANKKSGTRKKHLLLTIDASEYWKEVKEEATPPVAAMRQLLCFANVVPNTWDVKDRWVNTFFKRTFRPHLIVYDQDKKQWCFSNAFLKELRAQVAKDKKDLTKVKRCHEVFVKRNMQKYAKIVQDGHQWIEYWNERRIDVLNASKRLQGRPFLADALDVMYRTFRAPLKQDVILGGRDKGGVYTELTMGSAAKLMQKLEDLNILKEGCFVQEIGSGLGTIACHFALVYNCYVIGVEIEPERVNYGLASLDKIQGIWRSQKMQTLLGKPHNQPSGVIGYEKEDQQLREAIADTQQRFQELQRRVRFILADAKNAPMDDTTVYNCFDEAYNDNDSLDIMILWAISTALFGIFYKANKRPYLLKRLQDQQPLVIVMGKVALSKIEGGGTSTAVILGKNPSPRALVFGSRFPSFDVSHYKDIELQSRLAPITSEGWAKKDWVSEYRANVVVPQCHGKPVRLRKSRLPQQCLSSIGLRCDPGALVRNCDCKVTLTPLPAKATKKGKSGIHLTGYFANQSIPEKKLISLFEGRMSREKPKDCTYVTSHGPYYIDAAGKGNHMFLNHSCEPNCKLQELMRFEGNEGVPEVGIIAIRDIEKDEELTIDYGHDPVDLTFTNCLCGSPACRFEANQLCLFFNLFSPGYLRLGGKDRPAQVVQATLSGDLEAQDGRDQYRIERLKARTKGNVYAVSIDNDQKKGLDPDFHLDFDVSVPRTAISRMRALNVRFHRVYADWMWTPQPWWRRHIKEKFFLDTLPKMATENIITKGGMVFLPFNPHTLACLTKADSRKKNLSETLQYNFVGEFLVENALHDHELWKATQSCHHDTFRKAFEKDIHLSTQEYISFKKDEFLKLLPNDASKEAKDLVVKADHRFGLVNIRFIKLTQENRVKSSLFCFT